MGTNMYPSSSLLGQSKDAAVSAVPVDELYAPFGFYSFLQKQVATICAFTFLGNRMFLSNRNLQAYNLERKENRRHGKKINKDIIVIRQVESRREMVGESTRGIRK